MSGAGPAEEPGLLQRYDQSYVERSRELDEANLPLSDPSGVQLAPTSPKPIERRVRGSGSCSTSRTGCGDGQPRSSPAMKSKGADRGDGLRAHLPPILLSGPQPDRGTPLEGQAHSKEDRRPHQRGTHRGDGASTSSRK